MPYLSKLSEIAKAAEGKNGLDFMQLMDAIHAFHTATHPSVILEMIELLEELNTALSRSVPLNDTVAEHSIREEALSKFKAFNDREG